MRKNFFFISSLFIFIACSLFIVTIGHSASIKEQMAARIPAINALKDQGSIGENNKGFLEYRTGGTPQQALVEDENADRAVVYSAIGKSQGAPPALVGERRAKMIVENGQAGHWYQKPDGSWYKK
ncbi:MAG: YdbL family protein [Desulforhopalus sp.]